LFTIACVTAFLTSFYMMRACALTFMGEARERDRFAHAHESPLAMTLPLIVLAILSMALGWVLHMSGILGKLLSWPGTPEVHESHLVLALGLGSSIAGIVIGWLIYIGRWINPESIAKAFRPLYLLFFNKWYLDEIYDVVFVRPTLALSRAGAWIDDRLIDRTGVPIVRWIIGLFTSVEKSYHQKWWKYQ
jgi:NADH-quinone oxidoreductase subunit L